MRPIQFSALIRRLKEASWKNKVRIWRDIAKRMEKGGATKVFVNLGKINRIAKKNEVLLIPGKVLGYGDLNKPVCVSAWGFSSTAKEKIEKAKGKTLSINELLRENPKGSGVRIMV